MERVRMDENEEQRRPTDESKKQSARMHFGRMAFKHELNHLIMRMGS